MRQSFQQAFSRYNSKKPAEHVIAESSDPEKSLKKSLGALDLTILGVGAIIGAGIFVYAGLGAQLAGPNIIWSFVLVGLICALAGLAYAEMASAIPTSGSAFAYAYTSLGETWAWILGWALVLEYAIGSASVAVGWSTNFTALIEGLTGWHWPDSLANSPLSGVPGAIVNLPALLFVLVITAVLVVGAKESARLAGVFVVTKLAILLLVIGLGFFYIKGSNLGMAAPTDTAPDWAQALGAVGPILAGGAIIFFAYIGFDAVSTTAEEARNPKRDLPIGILGSLAICTVLYILASVVLLGMIQYTDLMPDCSLPHQGPCVQGNGISAATASSNLGQPFGYAFQSNGIDWAANVIRLGAVVGIASVLMVLLMGGPRIFFALARDGLLPKSWSSVHPRFGTPYKTTIGTGLAVAVVAGFGTLSILGQLTNIGTLFAFILVCIGVIVLRYKRADLVRPFKVPLNIGKFPILALLGAILCTALVFSLSPATILGFFGWMGVGLLVYGIYGIRKSNLYADHGRDEYDPGFAPKFYARLTGILVLLVGIVGVGLELAGKPDLMGSALTFDWTHDIVHIVLGLIGLVIGFAATRFSLLYTRLFGVVYFLLGIVGSAMPSLLADSLGLHFEYTENLIHLGLGFLGIVFGFAEWFGTMRGARAGQPAPAMAGGDMPEAVTEAAAEEPPADDAPKKKDTLGYAREMKTLRARAKAQPGGKGPIKDRPAAKKLRKKYGLE